jgi:hypothetical protein
MNDEARQILRGDMPVVGLKSDIHWICIYLDSVFDLELVFL